MGTTSPPPGIAATYVARVFGTAAAPLLIDVRRGPAFDTDTHSIAGALRRDPATVAQWADRLPSGRRVVVACVHGHEVSQNTAAALRAHGLDAAYLAGGIDGWRQAGGPMMRQRPDFGVLRDTPSCWVTRERPKIDRIACPWLIRRFVDPLATFRYVPTEHVFTDAAASRAIAYDIPGAEPFSHDGALCSFDAFLKQFELADPGLVQLAVIVRGADTARLDLSPQSAGLLAISLGLSGNFADDHAMLEHGLVLYDALYAWCRDLQNETHNWKPEAAT